MGGFSLTDPDLGDIWGRQYVHSDIVYCFSFWGSQMSRFLDFQISWISRLPIFLGGDRAWPAITWMVAFFLTNKKLLVLDDDSKRTQERLHVHLPLVWLSPCSRGPKASIKSTARIFRSMSCMGALGRGWIWIREFVPRRLWFMICQNKTVVDSSKENSLFDTY